MRHPRQSGFTLIELVITIAISAVLLAIAVPSFRTAAMNSRRTGATNELVAAFQYARSESLKRGVQVTVCPTTDPNATTPACASSANAAAGWQAGWIIYSDVSTASSGTSRPDTGGGDTLLKVGANDYSGVNIGASITTALASTKSSSSFSMQPFNRSSTRGTVTICDSRGTAFGRVINLDALGRPTISTTVTSCP